MRIARFSQGSSIHYGALEDESTRIVGLKGDPLFSPVEPSGQIFELDEVRLLSPVIPRSKVIGLGGNYPAPGEQRSEDPARPSVFFKPNTAVIGPDDPIVFPSWGQEIFYEAELAVVIKTLAKDVSVEDASSVILGYTCANDLTAADAARDDGGALGRAKSWDTACPLGPWITVGGDFDPDNAEISVRINGEERGSGSTNQMGYSVARIVSYVSGICTLLPGDVILTGTPAGGPLKHGERVEVEVAGIGTLTNLAM